MKRGGEKRRGENIRKERQNHRQVNIVRLHWQGSLSFSPDSMCADA